MNTPSPTLAAYGLCADCKTVHTLPVGNSRQYAHELMRQLDQHGCIDFSASPATRHPSLTTDYLWSEARGQMFGVLECTDDSGATVVLKAFSCQYNGEWVVNGWVPPIPDPDPLQELTRPGGAEPISSADRSRALMQQIHALYRLKNFRGETRRMTDLFTSAPSAGTGDCCAPKLLHHAATHGLRPVGLSEFFYGRENKSGTRHHKQFYTACAEKCRPILGFMLCGLPSERKSTGNPSLSSVEILHADDDLVVVVKPSGLLSVPGKGPNNQDCVTARIKAIFPDCPAHPEVHRLDMDTSGLMVLALNREAQRELSRQFHDRETSKKYLALLDGEIEGHSGLIKLPFRLDIDNRPMQIYDPIHGKIGITRWKNLGVENRKTRVEFVPITGRTHQLRVHAASEHGLGVPIVGDRLYGNGTAAGQLQLHASFLAFKHPISGKKMSFTSIPVPCR